MVGRRVMAENNDCQQILTITDLSELSSHSSIEPRSTPVALDVSMNRV